MNNNPEAVQKIIQSEIKNRYAISCKLEAAMKEYEAAIVEGHTDRAQKARERTHILQDMMLDSLGSVATSIRNLTNGL